MATMLIVRDETTTGELVQELSLEFVSPTVTIRELITSRVRQEVEAYNRKKPELFRGLVQPTNAEKTLNGYRLEDNKRHISWETQRERALEAFESDQILVLANGRQVESLDDTLELTPDTDVRFLRLVPLVGG
jgi:hypothetical protein